MQSQSQGRYRFVLTPFSGKVERLTSYFNLQYLKRKVLCLWSVLGQVGCQLSLGSIIFYSREGLQHFTDFISQIHRAAPWLLPHLDFKAILVFSGRRSHVCWRVPFGLFLGCLPPSLLLRWSSPAQRKGSGGGKGEIFNNDFINMMSNQTCKPGLYCSFTTLDLWLFSIGLNSSNSFLLNQFSGQTWKPVEGPQKHVDQKWVCVWSSW